MTYDPLTSLDAELGCETPQNKNREETMMSHRGSHYYGNGHSPSPYLYIDWAHNSLQQLQESDDKTHLKRSTESTEKEWWDSLWRFPKTLPSIFVCPFHHHQSVHPIRHSSFSIKTLNANYGTALEDHLSFINIFCFCFLVTFTLGHIYNSSNHRRRLGMKKGMKEGVKGGGRAPLDEQHMKMWCYYNPPILNGSLYQWVLTLFVVRWILPLSLSLSLLHLPTPRHFPSLLALPIYLLEEMSVKTTPIHNGLFPPKFNVSREMKFDSCKNIDKGETS